MAAGASRYSARGVVITARAMRCAQRGQDLDRMAMSGHGFGVTKTTHNSFEADYMC